MRPLQGPPQSHTQRGSQNDGHRAVEQGSGDLQRQSRRRHGSGETTHQQAVEGKKKKQLVKVTRSYPFDQIKYTKEWLDFK